MKVNTIAAALLAIGLAGPLQAATVYNGGAPDYQSGLYATTWFDNFTETTIVREAATMFTVGDGGLSFNGISWSGLYNYFGNESQAHGVQNSANAFTFKVYSLDGSLPGNELYSFALGTGNGVVDGPDPDGPEPDGPLTSYYSYTASFASTSLTQGTYFASLSNAYAFEEFKNPPEGDDIDDFWNFDWYWGSTSDSQLGAAYSDGGWNSGGGQGVSGLAFQLLGDEPTSNVPEPGSVALLALALAGLAASRRQLMPQPARLVSI